MHIHNRLPVVVAGLLLIPLAGVHMTASLFQREQTAVQFYGVTQQAHDHTRHSRMLLRDQELQQEHTSVVWKKLHSIERERRILQRQMNALRTEVQLHGSAGNTDGDRSAQLTRQRFSQPLSFSKAKRLINRLTFRAGHSDISMAERLLALKEQDHSLLQKEHQLTSHLALSERRVRASTQQLRAARQMTRQVQEVIDALQSQLERIDVQITRWQERRGIADGSLEAQRNKYAEPGDPVFIWPAKARISAGFRDHSYRKFFGIPHNGIDIAIGHGTPVHASTDGVVFLARDAGMGYSYVLIGHRNGFATLYGHLSQIAVQSGQEVQSGEVIGRSGGAKGTRGAGTVTTGAHLHFEVIQNGEHVDPLTVLQ